MGESLLEVDVVLEDIFFLERWKKNNKILKERETHQNSECELEKKVFAKKKKTLVTVGIPGKHGFEKALDTMLNSRKEKNFEGKSCVYDTTGMLYLCWEKRNQ